MYNTHPYFWIGKLKNKYWCITHFEINKIKVEKKKITKKKDYETVLCKAALFV
jgi:hypothetical protein